MPARRTVAPDIVGCSFVLYAATLSFAVLRAPWAHRNATAIATDVGIYGSLLIVCTAIALGLFRRRSWVLLPALLLSVVAFFAGLLAWHVPETAQLPAGVLGVVSVVLLLGRRVELTQSAPADAANDDDADPAATADRLTAAD